MMAEDAFRIAEMRTWKQGLQIWVAICPKGCEDACWVCGLGSTRWSIPNGFNREGLHLMQGIICQVLGSANILIFWHGGKHSWVWIPGLTSFQLSQGSRVNLLWEGANDTPCWISGNIFAINVIWKLYPRFKETLCPLFICNQCNNTI